MCGMASFAAAAARPFFGKNAISLDRREGKRHFHLDGAPTFNQCLRIFAHFRAPESASGFPPGRFHAQARGFRRGRGRLPKGKGPLSETLVKQRGKSASPLSWPRFSPRINLSSAPEMRGFLQNRPFQRTSSGTGKKSPRAKKLNEISRIF